MPLPALSSTQLPEAIPDWTQLDRKRVLEHFMLSRDYENIAEYISFQSDLLPDERVILFFLPCGVCQLHKNNRIIYTVYHWTFQLCEEKL